MFLKESTQLTSNFNLSVAWLGTTLFSGATLLEQMVNQINFLTIAGWIITSSITIVASVYKIIQTRAEIRKSNAIAEKIEKDVEEEEILKEESFNDDFDACKLNMCKYKMFYDDFSPIIINRLEKES